MSIAIALIGALVVGAGLSALMGRWERRRLRRQHSLWLASFYNSPSSKEPRR